MNFGFEIVTVKEGVRASVYTIKIDGETKTELDKFLTNPELNKAENKEKLIQVAKNVRRDIPQKGAKDYYLDYESSSTNAVRKIKHTELRLFCLRYGSLLVIFGNGGIKPEGAIKTQDVPKFVEIVEQLKYIESRIKEAQKQGKFDFTDNGKITKDSKTKFKPL